MSSQTTIEDQVFRDPISNKIGYDVYRIIVSGKLIGAEWTSLGAAKAGLEVEQRRASKGAN